MPDGPACYDCGLAYSDARFADFVLPDDLWARISPSGDEGGLLCANCIVGRMRALGLTGSGQFRSGPFAG